MTVTVRGGVGNSNNSDPAIVSTTMVADTTVPNDQSNYTPLGQSTTITTAAVNVVPPSTSLVTTGSMANHTITSSPANSLIGNDPVSSSSSLSEANTIIDGQDGGSDGNNAIEDNGGTDTISGDPGSDESDIKFPIAELNRLDDMINRPRWVIPVLPKGELEVLLDASIALAKKGVDHLYEPCQRFYREGLTISFTKILTDEAVSGWKIEIHVSN